jgi:hypothetical protein
VILDFEGGTLVQRRTRSKERPFRAETARKRNQIFRKSPIFDLALLRDGGGEAAAPDGF